MKTLITIILLFNAYSIDSKWVAFKAPKKASKIALLLNNPSQESCKSIVIKHMQASGYQIASNEKSSFKINSKPKSIGITEINVEVNGSKTDSGYFVVFSPQGVIKTNTSIGDGVLNVNNSGLKGSLGQKAWDDIDAMCKKISPKLYYKTAK